jgi:hypothetical protein
MPRMERRAVLSPKIVGPLLMVVVVVTAVTTHYVDRSNPLTLFTMPDRHEMARAARWLHEYYASPEGLQRQGGLGQDGNLDFDALGAWVFDVYMKERINHASEQDARAAVMRAIESTDEWRAKHPAPH